MTKRTIFIVVTFFSIIIAFLGVKYVLKNQNFELSQKEANAGNLIAQYNMGLMYFRGDGVVQNYQEAFKWFEKSAVQNHKLAQEMLQEK